MANKPENLKPFKKGDPRTIAAAKKSKRGPSLKTALKRMFEKGDVDIDDFIMSMAKNAMKGNSGIAKLIFEYLDGKVPQIVQNQGSNDIVIMTAEEKAVYDKLHARKPDPETEEST